MTLIGIFISLVVFSIIILVHEYGHFKTARIFGVKVEEFGLGIPPRAKKIFTDKKGTLYSLNWLPLGGFVRLKGENIQTFQLYTKAQTLHNNESLEKTLESNEAVYDRDGNILYESERQAILQGLKENSAPDSLLTKSYWKQAIIVLAGVVMNFILAVIIFTLLFFTGVKPIGINDTISLSSQLKLIPTPQQATEIGLITQGTGIYLVPIDHSLAQKAGIKKYDFVEQVNDETILNYTQFKDIISAHKKNPVTIKGKRATKDCDIRNSEMCQFENFSLSITPDDTGKIGAYLVPNTKVNQDFEYQYGFLESLKYGITETSGHIELTLKGLGMLVKKILRPETPQERTQAIQEVSGPIGMVDFMSNSMKNGITFIIIIGAVISINLGVFNLLPIPALDGGRFLFIFINGIVISLFGKKAINEKVEGWIHVGFFLFLIALSIGIAYNDISKIINN